MTEQLEERRRPSITSLVAFGMVVVPILYVLAPGPLARYGPVESDRFTDVYFAVFGPIVWAYEKSPIVEGFYDWYFRLWGVE